MLSTKMPLKPLWNSKPSQHVAACIERANKRTMLITKTSGPLSFVLHDESNKTSCKVTLGEIHSCDCGEFRKTPEPCTHICWLMLKKFKVDPSDEIMFQSGLNENYLRSLFNLERYHAMNKIGKEKKAPEAGKKNRSKVLTRDDECPICFDKFYQSLKGVTQCNTCFNHVHIPCRNLWKRNGDSDNKDRCPYCRGNFGMGTPVLPHCLPWRKVSSDKKPPPPVITTNLLEEPNFLDQIIKGHSVNRKQEQKPERIPLPSKSTPAPLLHSQPSLFLGLSSKSLLPISTPKPEFDVSGRGLPQYNSSQHEVGPILENSGTTHHQVLPEKVERNIFERTVAAIRHNQQVGMKGPALMTRLKHGDGDPGFPDKSFKNSGSFKSSSQMDLLTRTRSQIL